MGGKFDVLIRGANVYDGGGGAAWVADVGVSGDRIAKIGSLDGAEAAVEIDADAKSLSLAPGFIDVHTHDDFAALAQPDMQFKTRGGVTACIVGNCGFGAAPYDAAIEMLASLTPEMKVSPYEGYAGYAAAVEARPPGVNIGVLAGHGTIRKACVGEPEREPTSAQMAAMVDVLNEGLDAGVLGMSSGLIYEPGRHARTEELVELASAMRGSGALYATHMRDEGTGLLESVEEAIAIGAGAGVAVQISHHKASGRDSWGLVQQSIALIEAAQARGESVHADQYPYTAGSTTLAAVLRLGVFTDQAIAGFASVRAEDVVVASAPDFSELEGQSIAALAQASGRTALDEASDIVNKSPGTTVILHMMSEDDVQRVLAHPSTMIGSDGIPTLKGKPHPRLYNTFARVLGHYARDVGLFDISTAIYRMTGFCAEKFGLTDRGRIREGAFADLVIFDAGTIIDKGTFEQPNQYPVGIKDVFVNGVHTVRDAQATDNLGGRVLRRQ